MGDLPDATLALLWDAVVAEVKKRTGPYVSMAKFLHQPDEQKAGEYWVEQARGVIGAVVPGDVTLASSGEPVLLYPDGVSLRFDLSEVKIASHGTVLWRAARRPLAAAIVTEALGHARWGDQWDHLVAARAPKTGPIVQADVDREFPWIAQNPAVPGPWTGAKTEELALRAARAEALGPKKIARLYERMRKHS
ncbi:hypothetical protein [Microbacterium luticocti]|uniref:hypothetical protein n=1 Tax=Microbacterium luticocti TaxID=451764 RepID=UPI00048C2AB0|nr:hypothetical protein [Microbacterium luticocti]